MECCVDSWGGKGGGGCCCGGLMQWNDMMAGGVLCCVVEVQCHAMMLRNDVMAVREGKLGVGGRIVDG